jgi:hypothetical protein
MKYKVVLIVECSTNHVKQVEAACCLYKCSGLLIEDFGQHATMVRAPEKGNDVDKTKLQRYHALLNAHNAVQLSSGLVSLGDIINSNYKVDVSMWKPSTCSNRPTQQFIGAS